MAINQIASLRMGTKFKKTPIGEIPVEWEIGVVGDIATLGRGRVISKIDLEKNPGPYPVYSSQSKEEGIFGYLASYDFDGDYVTWTTDGAYAGSVFFRSGKFNCTNVCGTIKVKEGSKAIPQFLALTLSTRTAGFVSHVGNPKLMNNVMAKIPIILPPISEQTKIAKILSSVDDVIEKADAVISKTRDLKKGLMQRLLTRGLNHTKFKKSPIGEIPREWELIKLGSVANFRNGHGFKPSEWVRIGIPIIRIQNLNGAEEFNYFDGKPDEDWLVNSGDLLFSWSGSRGTSFGPFMWRGGKGVLNQHIYNVFPVKGIDKGFLFYYLRQITGEIEHRAHGSAGLVHITKQELSAFDFPVPSFAEQIKIAGILSSVDDAIEKSESERDRLEQTKKSLVSDLLTGRVRVNQ